MTAPPRAKLGCAFLLFTYSWSHIDDQTLDLLLCQRPNRVLTLMSCERLRYSVCVFTYSWFVLQVLFVSVFGFEDFWMCLDKMWTYGNKEVEMPELSAWFVKSGFEHSSAWVISLAHDLFQLFVSQNCFFVCVCVYLLYYLINIRHSVSCNSIF